MVRVSADVAASNRGLRSVVFLALVGVGKSSCAGSLGAGSDQLNRSPNSFTRASPLSASYAGSTVAVVEGMNPADAPQHVGREEERILLPPIADEAACGFDERRHVTMRRNPMPRALDLEVRADAHSSRRRDDALDGKPVELCDEHRRERCGGERDPASDQLRDAPSLPKTVLRLAEGACVRDRIALVVDPPAHALSAYPWSSSGALPRRPPHA